VLKTKKLETLRAAIQLGDNQISRDECEPYPSAMMAELTQQTLENSKLGKKLNPNFTP